MSTELPDFTTAPAWMGASGEVVLGATLVTAVNCRHLMVIDWPDLDAPWTPLRTSVEWAREYSDERCGCLVLGCPCTTDPDASEVAPADEWVKRIDMDKLAALLAPFFSGADRAHEEHYTCADAAIAALPELMKGESDE